ncbi:MAG TPA: hypothetical protein VFD84_01200 [Candidatus Binatia bacterium]|nr:hypothetical protein [Candidatus Binatia bacterium]
MTTQGIAASREQTVERREQSIRRGTYVRPPVDVFETDDALVLVADVPGVAPEASRWP